MVPGELENDMNKFTDLESYEEERKYILDRVNQRREPVFEGKPSKPTFSTEEEQNATDAQEQCEDMMAIAGRFHGACHTCGEWGHRMNQCPVKGTTCIW